MGVNIQKVGNINNYKISKHAAERFKERVLEDTEKNVSLSQVKKWLMVALTKGYEVDNDDNRTRYRYADFLIVMDNNVLVTISHYNFNEFKYIQEELGRKDTERLKREVRELVYYRKRLMVKANNIDNKRIMSESANEQQKLKIEISKIQEEVSVIKKRIKALRCVANKYKIDQTDIFLEGDLI
ncbi:hypothetical protein vBSscSF1_112 [Staphylococcus phage vB-SscS-F1]|nr:hypothetical protein vBApySJF1_112 [Arcanobacterium phage vB-ApyS-JF1]